ncbi:hypothetical protein HDU96_000394 [Phlyctochytrium bullatum]|nr:hypothetical protein HDU96_000394 [Phlyctochytrium bullatum]
MSSPPRTSRIPVSASPKIAKAAPPRHPQLAPPTAAQQPCATKTANTARASGTSARRGAKPSTVPLTAPKPLPSTQSRASPSMRPTRLALSAPKCHSSYKTTARLALSAAKYHSPGETTAFARFKLGSQFQEHTRSRQNSSLNKVRADRGIAGKRFEAGAHYAVRSADSHASPTGSFASCPIRPALLARVRLQLQEFARSGKTSKASIAAKLSGPASAPKPVAETSFTPTPAMMELDQEPGVPQLDQDLSDASLKSPLSATLMPTEPMIYEQHAASPEDKTQHGIDPKPLCAELTDSKRKRASLQSEAQVLLNRIAELTAEKRDIKARVPLVTGSEREWIQNKLIRIDQELGVLRSKHGKVSRQCALAFGEYQSSQARLAFTPLNGEHKSGYDNDSKRLCAEFNESKSKWDSLQTQVQTLGNQIKELTAAKQDTKTRVRNVNGAEKEWMRAKLIRINQELEVLRSRHGKLSRDCALAFGEYRSSMKKITQVDSQDGPESERDANLRTRKRSMEPCATVVDPALGASAISTMKGQGGQVEKRLLDQLTDAKVSREAEDVDMEITMESIVPLVTSQMEVDAPQPERADGVVAQDPMTTARSSAIKIKPTIVWPVDTTAMSTEESEAEEDMDSIAEESCPSTPVNMCANEASWVTETARTAADNKFAKLMIVMPVDSSTLVTEGEKAGEWEVNEVAAAAESTWAGMGQEELGFMDELQEKVPRRELENQRRAAWFQERRRQFDQERQWERSMTRTDLSYGDREAERAEMERRDRRRPSPTSTTAAKQELPDDHGIRHEEPRLKLSRKRSHEEDESCSDTKRHRSDQDSYP